MNIGIVIPYYNGDEFIDSCLQSLRQESDHFIRVYVVNNSDRQTIINDIATEYNFVRVYNAPPKIGYGQANNIGSTLAISEGADIIISLNQDTILGKDCINQLILPFTTDADIHLTAPINLTYDFNNIDEIFIKYYLSQCPEFIYDAIFGLKKAHYQLKNVTGSCFAIRVSTIKLIGLFDPLYFMYNEDDDLCRRIRYINKKIVIVTNAKVAHIHSYKDETLPRYNELYRWKRISRTIYTLKDFGKSTKYNVRKVLSAALLEYAQEIGCLRLNVLLRYLMDDIKLLVNIKDVIKSRESEKRMFCGPFE